jgi:hypothetical protein
MKMSTGGKRGTSYAGGQNLLPSAMTEAAVETAMKAAKAASAVKSSKGSAFEALPCHAPAGWVLSPSMASRVAAFLSSLLTG